MHRLNEAIGFSAVQGTLITIIFLFSTIVFGSLKFYNDLSLMAYLIFPCITISSCIIALVINPILGNITGYARQFKSTWIAWNAQRIDLVEKYDNLLSPFKTQYVFHKVLSSCADVQVKNGIFYGYTSETTVAFCQICVDNSINLVMTF